MNSPKYQIGDEVWIPRFSPMETRIKCPDCLGTKALTVIMGDGSQVSIDCVGCALGYEPSRGFVVIHEWKPYVDWGRIDGVERRDNTFEYRGYQFGGLEESKLTKSKEEAEAIAARMAEEHKVEELHRFEQCKENTRRSWAWNAHYHRQKVKQAQHDLEYHTAKLNVAKVKAKEGEPVTP